MVNCCSVFGCSSRSNRVKKSFYNFPAIIRHQGDETQRLSTKRRATWIASLRRRDWTPAKASRVCSDHFHSGKPSNLYDVSNPDWAPTLNLGYAQKQKVGTMERYERAKKRSKQKRLATTFTDNTNQQQQDLSGVTDVNIPENNAWNTATNGTVVGIKQERDPGTYMGLQTAWIGQVLSQSIGLEQEKNIHNRENTNYETTFNGEVSSQGSILDLQQKKNGYIKRENMSYETTSNGEVSSQESVLDLQHEKNGYNRENMSLQTTLTGEVLPHRSINLQPEGNRINTNYPGQMRLQRSLDVQQKNNMHYYNENMNHPTTFTEEVLSPTLLKFEADKPTKIDSCCQTDLTGEVVSPNSVELQKEKKTSTDNSCQTELTGEIISEMCYVVF